MADPTWLTGLCTNGCNLQLADILIQAGRHFSGRVNPDNFAAGPSRRQLATAMAWTILSLIAPAVTAGQLVVEDPLDGDIKILCSEILGVGMSLEALRKTGVTDGRTIRKLSAGFDFEAIEKGGGGRVLIEAKGTFRDASTSEHRKSIYDKIITRGLPRNYRRAIGLIASPWTASDMQTFNLEICDQEEPADDRGFVIHRLMFGSRANRGSLRPVHGWAGNLCSSYMISWSSLWRCATLVAHGIRIGDL